MRLAKLSPESFSEYGEMLALTDGLLQELRAGARCEIAKSAQSMQLWQYADACVLIPQGLGALFVRNEAGFLKAFLFSTPLRLRPAVWFCVLPFKNELRYELYAGTPRQIMRTDRAMTASQITPRLKLDQLYNVLLCREEDAYAFEEEAHSFWELIYLLEGSMSFELRGERLKLRQNELLLVPPEQTHRLIAENERLRFLQASFSMQLSPRSWIVGRPSAATERQSLWLNELLREAEQQYPYCEDLQLAALNGVIVTMLRAPTLPEEQPAQPRSKNEIVAACLKLIDEDIAAKLTKTYLAERLGVSPGALLSAFKEEMGVGIAAYIKERRLQQARMLLTEGDCSVTQVSDMLGYCSVCYFSAEYKKQFGVTPSEQLKAGRLAPETRSVREGW